MSEQSSTEVPMMYSNAVRVAIGFTEIRLFFGEAVLPPPPPNMQPGQLFPAGQARQVDRLSIALSPDIIPALVAGLQKAIETYQSQFGQLRKLPQTKPLDSPPEPKQ